MASRTKKPKPKLLLRTHLGYSKIYIYFDRHSDAFAYTWDKNKQDSYVIEFGPRSFMNRAEFMDSMVHELTHILEYEHAKDKDRFNPKLVNGCSKLARTIGAGVGEMLARMYYADKELWEKLTAHWAPSTLAL